MTFLKQISLETISAGGLGGGNELEDRTASCNKIQNMLILPRFENSVKNKINEIKTKVILISLVTLLASQLRFRISRFLDYQRSKETFATHTVEGHDEAQSVCDEM